jgi:hypothetical protein
MTDGPHEPRHDGARDAGDADREPGSAATNDEVSASEDAPDLRGADSPDHGDAAASDSADHSDGAAEDPPDDGEAAGAGESATSGVSAPDSTPVVHGAYADATAEQLLSEARTVRRQARRARHAYWFPLVLFGLLSCASVPFYLRDFPPARGLYLSRNLGPAFLRSQYLGGFGFVTGVGTAWYWLAAILIGLTATAVWYRLRGNRVGLRTPSRGFVITGLVLVVLALVIPVLARQPGLNPLVVLMPGDLLIRGTFPPVLIGIGLCVLAWAERSIALAVIAAGYLALSLVGSLYDVENVFYDLGWHLSPAASGLPNVVLPALVLLLSGAGAWVGAAPSAPRASRPG